MTEALIFMTQLIGVMLLATIIFVICFGLAIICIAIIKGFFDGLKKAEKKVKEAESKAKKSQSKRIIDEGGAE